MVLEVFVGLSYPQSIRVLKSAHLAGLVAGAQPFSWYLKKWQLGTIYECYKLNRLKYLLSSTVPAVVLIGAQTFISWNNQCPSSYIALSIYLIHLSLFFFFISMKLH